jgi:hypothetical protein
VEVSSRVDEVAAIRVAMRDPYFEFLKTEVDLALTLIRVAEVEAQSPADTEHAARAIAKATEALYTVHHCFLKFPFTRKQMEYLEERCRLIESLIGLERSNPLLEDC